MKSDFNALKSVLDALQQQTSATKSELASLKASAATKTEMETLRTSLIPPTWRPFFDSGAGAQSVTKLRQSVANCGLSHFPCPMWFGPILLSLRIRFGGNVHEKQIVNITSSSLLYGEDRYHGRAAADWNSADAFISSNESVSQWLRFDFKDRRVRVTRYAIMSSCADHPRSWVLEGSSSVDASTWSLLDSQSNNNDLNGDCRVASFPVASFAEYRYLRLRQTGTNHTGRGYFELAALEFFGSIRE
jgi:hypothetical protein